MKYKYRKILDLYENFKLHRGELSGKEGFFDYQAPTSIHSGVTAYAYGIKETNSCLSLLKYNCESRIILNKNDLKRRFYIKLKAQLFDWTKEVCEIAININGTLAYKNDSEFFENVHVGWPTIYIPIDGALLKVGENIIEINAHADDTYLMVTKLDLVSLPAITEAAQLTLKTAVREGDVFTLSFYSPHYNAEVISAQSCEVTELLRSPINKEHFLVKIKASSKKPLLKLRIGNKTINAVMPEVFPKSLDNCLMGTDSDDHRQDMSDEAERILEIFTNTNMGNYWQARPKKRRNYHTIADEATWKKRVDYLKNFNVKLGISGGEKDMPFFSELCGDSFIGKHFHEAYLFFNIKLKDNEYFKKALFMDMDALQRSESFGESKKMFCDALKKMYLSSKTENGLTSVGSPSLLTIYEAACGFERVTIEPISNVNLLIGAVRGTAPHSWGAHVPTDWYFGEPNNITKARKFLLAINLLYMSGADYIYAENALFKTNAYSREDWDDEFCIACRSYLRELYDYSVKNPREGKLKKNFAAIYGNNEYFLWLDEDRDAALYEDGDWDITLWGKWKEASHQKCWGAIYSWLPLSKNQITRKNCLNKNLFSGTPYGQVDIIPYESDYSSYKAVVLLGWNTYEEGFGKKIRNYVENGGTAFVSYCHFNKTDRSDRPMEYATVSDLGITCGEIILTSGSINYGGRKKEISGDLKIAKCDDGEKFICDEKGNAIVLRKKMGKGTLYFGTFADYNCTADRLAIMEYVLDTIGKDEADIICTNPNISFAERIMDDGSSTIDVLNMCPAGKENENYELIFKNGQKIKGTLAPCELKSLK